ncbi:MAG: hypothetical protein SWI22_08525 [Pseudomonadota bacterium]|nr:hypothetical protein [Pseudomonadota bacterium]
MTTPHDPAPAPPPPAPRPAALSDLSEDALGFGAAELVTARDLLLRPRQVLEAWMTRGPSGGGHYARPLRLYLGLNAILMLVLFLQGGTGLMLGGLGESMLQPMVEASGKSRDAFLADADNWMTLVLVPLLSLAYACVATPLLRWWDPEVLGWRRGFRAAFAYLCAWTVPMLPLSWWAYNIGPAGQAVAAALFVIGIVTFMRMGAGRWWRSPVAGLGKAVVLAVTIQLASVFGMLPVLAIGLLAGRFG